MQFPEQQNKRQNLTAMISILPNAYQRNPVQIQRRSIHDQQGREQLSKSPSQSTGFNHLFQIKYSGVLVIIINIIFQMSQRRYSPDQLPCLQRKESPEDPKKLRQGGSTNKLLCSVHRFCEDQVSVGEYSYRLSDQIGAGYSSRVYKARGRDKLQYAVKVIEMNKFSASGVEMLENEIQILKSLSHPNVIKLYHSHRAHSHTYIVTELCKGGDLLQVLSRKGRLAEDLAGSIMSDVIEGTKYLMSMGIVHRDLKPANVLRSDRTWKIADFGFSIRTTQQVRTRQNVGTPLYMPIESLLKNIYSPESDIFAVGVMYYELLVGLTPWQCRSEKELIRKLTTIPFSVPEKHKLSAHIKFLLNKLCAVDKSTRMQKQEFFELNLKNFVSLNNFNDPLASSKKLEDSKKSHLRSPANKIKRSKSQAKGTSKEKQAKGQAEQEYKLNRKKSAEKGRLRKNSAEKQKEVLSSKAYALKEEGSSVASLLSSDNGVDRFEVINEDVLLSQLDHCRFLYYLIQNSPFVPLPQEPLSRIVTIVFKHLLKLIKQLADPKTNYFGLPHWDAFKQSAKAKNLFATCQEYCQKYEREYLNHLKEADINLIKEVNQKFSELGNAEPLSLSVYRKIQAVVVPALKECLASPLLGEERGAGPSEGFWEGVRSLFQYYRWVELNTKYFENYVLQKKHAIVITKNFKNSQISKPEFAKVCDEIRVLE